MVSFILNSPLLSGVAVEASGDLSSIRVVAPEGIVELVEPIAPPNNVGGAKVSFLVNPAILARDIANVVGSLPALRIEPPEPFTLVDSDARLTQMGLSAVGTVSVEVRNSQIGAGIAAIPAVDYRLTQFGMGALAVIDTHARITAMGLMVLVRTDSMLQPNPLRASDRGRKEILDMRIVNMYPEPTPDGPSDFILFGRPGLVAAAERGSGPIRALFYWKGFTIAISGNEVWVDDRDVGFLENTDPDEPVYWAVSSDEAVVNVGGLVYRIDEVSVQQASNSDLHNIRGVAFLAGRFVYIVDDNSGMYRYSEVGNALSLDGLDFASAESDPDPIRAVAVVGDNLVFFGQTTTEWHYATSSSEAPFIRSQGRTYDKGSNASQSIVEINGVLYFLGDDKVYYKSGAQPIPISDPETNRLLQKIPDVDIDKVVAHTCFYEAHHFLVINIPGQVTRAYDTTHDTWADWESYGYDQYRVISAAEQFFGDRESGKIFYFEGQTFVDDGDDTLRRICSSFLPVVSGRQRVFNVTLMARKSVGRTGGVEEQRDPVVEMRFSDELGEPGTWSNWQEEPLAPQGETGKNFTSEWLGLGNVSPPGRVFEFRCSDPVAFEVYQVKFNEVHAR